MPNQPIQKASLPQAQGGASRDSKGQYIKKPIDVTRIQTIRNFLQAARGLGPSTDEENNEDFGDTVHVDDDIEVAAAEASEIEDPEVGLAATIAALTEAPTVLGAKIKSVQVFKTREHYGKYSKQEKDIIEDPLMIEFIQSKSSMVVFWGEKVKPLDNKSRMTYGTFKERVTQHVKAINRERLGAEKFKVPRNRTKPNEESLLAFYLSYQQKKKTTIP